MLRASMSITKDQEVKTRWAKIEGEPQYLVIEIGRLSLYIDESELPRFKKALRTSEGYRKSKIR